MVESKRERYVRLLKSKSDLQFVELSFDAAKEIIELLEYPEPKKGKWINRQLVYTDLTIATCSACGKRLAVGKYCPNCGAKMEG